jgi:hypothetical protein
VRGAGAAVRAGVGSYLVRRRGVLVPQEPRAVSVPSIDDDGVVVDILLREYRDAASAEAFFRQAIERNGVIPDEMVTDYHSPSIETLATTCPGTWHLRTGLYRARGETTKAVERSHVPMRDRLRNSRGLQQTATGQRFLEGFDAVGHLRRGGSPGPGHLVPGPATSRARSRGGSRDSRHRAGCRR